MVYLTKKIALMTHVSGVVRSLNRKAPFRSRSAAMATIDRQKTLQTGSRRFHHVLMQLVIVAVAVLLCHPRSANAACVATDLTMNPPTPLSYSGAADAIHVGDVIGGGSWMGTTSNATVLDMQSCPKDNPGDSWPGFYSYAIPTGLVVPGVTYNDGLSVFPVFSIPGIQGIGYVIGIRDFHSTGAWIPINYSDLVVGGVRTYPAAGLSGATPSLGFQVELKYVITGQLRSGTYNLPLTRVATLTGYGSNNYRPILSAGLWVSPVSINVVANSCTVTSGGNQSITLPTVNAAKFPLVGSVSTEHSDFSMSLSCPTRINLYATMTDVNQPNNRSGTLTVASGSAGGVGLVIYANGNSSPVSYGPDSSQLANTNQWYIGAGTSFSVPFKVAYIRTGDMSSGNVSAAATITFSYQ